MKIAVVGAGAIGGYLGAKLARAGEDVTFIARNKNLAAINADGFRLILEDGSDEHAPTARAVQKMADAGPQDAVLLTVKAHQVGDLLPELRDLFGPDTMVVTMINGLPWWYFHKLAGPYEGRSLESVDPGGRIAAHIEPERIVGSIVYPATELVSPGVVRVIEGNRFSLGELDGERTPRIEALSQVLMKVGFKAPVARDIRSELWVKLWGNLSFNPISALTHATLEDICRFPAIARAGRGADDRGTDRRRSRRRALQGVARPAHRRRRGGGRAQDVDAGRRGTRGARWRSRRWSDRWSSSAASPARRRRSSTRSTRRSSCSRTRSRRSAGI